MTGRIDVHSHLLPGIDDGCTTVQQSTECARLLVAAGYSHAFCTPHILPMYPHIRRDSVVKWTASLQRELDRTGVNLKLMPGGELNLNAAVTAMTSEQIIPLGLESRFVLTDIWCDQMPEFFEPAVKRLQGLGYTVILAHPERCRAVQDQPDLSGWFADLGILLQGNLQCLSDRPEMRTRQVAEQYLKDGKYFILGSDTHNPQSLPFRIAGLQNAIKLVGEEAVRTLTVTNPATLMV